MRLCSRQLKKLAGLKNTERHAFVWWTTRIKRINEWYFIFSLKAGGDLWWNYWREWQRGFYSAHLKGKLIWFGQLKRKEVYITVCTRVTVGLLACFIFSTKWEAAGINEAPNIPLFTSEAAKVERQKSRNRLNIFASFLTQSVRQTNRRCVTQLRYLMKGTDLEAPLYLRLCKNKDDR